MSVGATECRWNRTLFRQYYKPSFRARLTKSGVSLEGVAPMPCWVPCCFWLPAAVSWVWPARKWGTSSSTETENPPECRTVSTLQFVVFRLIEMPWELIKGGIYLFAAYKSLLRHRRLHLVMLKCLQKSKVNISSYNRYIVCERNWDFMILNVQKCNY